MVVDTSALLAVILEEPDGSLYYSAMDNSPVCIVSAVSLVEASIVLVGRRTTGGTALLDTLLHQFNMEVVSTNAQPAQIAREAFRRFGKGRHKADLNFGDCFSYALAKETGEPLLFKGDDFTHTDLTRA